MRRLIRDRRRESSALQLVHRETRDRDIALTLSIQDEPDDDIAIEPNRRREFLRKADMALRRGIGPEVGHDDQRAARVVRETGEAVEVTGTIVEAFGPIEILEPPVALGLHRRISAQSEEGRVEVAELSLGIGQTASVVGVAICLFDVGSGIG